MKPWRRIQSRFPDSPFLRGVTQLTGATLAGQAIVLLAVPLLTRLYDPQAFGAAAVFASLTSILYPVSSLRYELAIPLPKEDEAAASLLVLSLLLLFPTAIVTAFVIWLVGSDLAELTNSTAIAAYLWVVPLGLFGVGALQAVTLWAVRLGDYRAVARSRIFQGFGLVLVQAGGALVFGPSVPWLLGGQLVGQTLGLGSVSRDAWRRSHRLFRSINLTGIMRMARRYKRFPQVSLWAGLVDSLALFVPGVLLAATYGLQAAGHYALASRVIGLPMTLVGHSVSTVYLGEASRAALETPLALQDIHHRTAKTLLVFGALPTLAMGVVSALIGGWVFGPSWSEAGLFMLILSPSYAAGLVAVPLSSTLVITEMLGREALWDSVRLLLVLASILVPFALGLGVTTAIISFSAVMVLTYAALLVLTRHASKGTRTQGTDVQA